jgi:crotonobetainyl-CoA:carnitine CoA-transferase CaiB-like acyl-CoA transferase
MTHMEMESGLLKGIQVVNLASNIPGPGAAARLLAMGASVLKVEPPQGDPFERLCASWYRELCVGQEIRRMDLKWPEGRAELEARLVDCDLLITSIRPSALGRLSLEWTRLHAAHPRLCQVAIVGFPAPNQDRAGHDLTYAAAAGLVSPPRLPSTLVADLMGVDRTVSSALALLFGRERGLGGGFAEVALEDGAQFAADPLRHGLTAPGGILGGGLPHYNLYRTREGWIALAALEPHFWSRLTQELGIPEATSTPEDLQRAFLSRDAGEWEAWAVSLDLPLVALRASEVLTPV